MKTPPRSSDKVKHLSLGLGALSALFVACSDDATTPDRSVPPLTQGGSAGAGGRLSGGGTGGNGAVAGAGGTAGRASAAGNAGASSSEAGTGGAAGSNGEAGVAGKGGDGGAGAAGKGGNASAGAAGKGGNGNAGAAGKASAAGNGGAASSGGAAGGGGSAGGGNVVACDRVAATKTAPLSLLTALEAALAGAPNAAAKATLVEGFLADVKAQGGTPLVADDAASDDVAFVIRGAPFQGTFHVAGGFNGWSESALPMKPLGGTDLYVATAKISRALPQPYKLVDVPAGKAGVYFEDRLARHVVWDGIDHHDVGEMNALVRAEAGDPKRGRLEAFRDVASKALGNSRDVFVYVPPSYDDASCPKLPVLVVHDGNESITRAPFHLAADDHFVAQPNDAAVLVFVALHAQTERIDDYTFATATGRADTYGDALRDEILPWAADTHRLCAAPRDRGLTGASLGGLVSTYLGLRDPGTWGYIGAQSPSYWWEEKAIFPIAMAKPVATTRVYVDNGCAQNGVDQDGCENAAAFVKLLDDKGWDVKHVVEIGGQHDWTFWQKRWPQMLTRFREGRVGCE